ncbi:hypothetical protein M4R22_19625 [Acidovorax sp. GBBC 3334]|uniref:hypothetical protein n=1 Tax=Acidovorax sp. GBBC 3334 TaxID=2940496 RepID=UPI0023029D1C|nr:hypothetical protein [Acidovorax sp. GBBC 3334]MDA8456974.1 hypothetical protein [Acidovorax sp. GBBC 3334]
MKSGKASRGPMFTGPKAEANGCRHAMGACGGIDPDVEPLLVHQHPSSHAVRNAAGMIALATRSVQHLPRQMRGIRPDREVIRQLGKSELCRIEQSILKNAFFLSSRGVADKRTGQDVSIEKYFSD